MLLSFRMKAVHLQAVCFKVEKDLIVHSCLMFLVSVTMILDFLKKYVKKK